LTGVQRITSVTWPVTICDLCCSFVVIGGAYCVTGGVPVSFWSVSNRFIAIVTGLTGVIGRFETVDQFSKDEFGELRLL
jgi:flagellar motor component MotA